MRYFLWLTSLRLLSTKHNLMSAMSVAQRNQGSNMVHLQACPLDTKFMHDPETCPDDCPLCYNSFRGPCAPLSTIPPREARDAIAILMRSRAKMAAHLTRTLRIIHRASGKTRRNATHLVSNKHAASVNGTGKLCSINCSCRWMRRTWWNQILQHKHLRALPLHVEPVRRQARMFSMFKVMGIDYEDLIWRSVLRNHHQCQARCAQGSLCTVDWAYPLLTSINQAVPVD